MVGWNRGGRDRETNRYSTTSAEEHRADRSRAWLGLHHGELKGNRRRGQRSAPSWQSKRRLTRSSIHAKVGASKPDDLVVSLLDLPAGPGRVARDIVERDVVAGGSTGGKTKTEVASLGGVKIDDGSSFL